MLNINSYMPVKIISGEGCLKKNKDIFKTLGLNCLIVCGKNSAKQSGALNDAIDVLSEYAIKYTIFDRITQNPFTETCYEAGKLAREINADFILGIGGGSVLDAAKAIAIYASNVDMKHDDIYNRCVPAKKISVILVGTTAGTGSEVTGVSVLTNSSTGLKKSISGEDCYALVSFCDYTYTLSTNYDTAVSTALDSLAHAVESYFSTSANDLVHAYSKKSLELMGKHILNANFSNLTKSEKEELYIASIYSGLAINISGTAFPHTVGYFLTEQYNIPHGKACAVFMPNLLNRAKKYCPEKLEAILKILNCDLQTLINRVNYLSDVHLTIPFQFAEEISLRWKNGIKNFDRTPGGFDYNDAKNAIIEIIS